MAKRTYRRIPAIDERQTILGREDRNIFVAHKEFRTVARWFLTVRMLVGFQRSFFNCWFCSLGCGGMNAGTPKFKAFFAA
jgi:hypothetical protein